MHDPNMEFTGANEVKWKQNFRNALRKRNVLECSYDSKASGNYKTFRFEPLKSKRNGAKPQSAVNGGLIINPNKYISPTDEIAASYNIVYTSNFPTAPTNGVVTNDPNFLPQSAPPDEVAAFDDVMTYELLQRSTVEEEQKLTLPPTKRARREELNGLTDYVSLSSSDPEVSFLDQFDQGFNLGGSLASDASGNSEFSIQLLYQEQLVLTQRIRTTSGAKIVCELPKGARKNEETLILLPPLENMFYKTYIESAKLLHNAIADKGIVLQCDSMGNLKVTRDCKCKIYKGNQAFERHKKTEIFNMDSYKAQFGLNGRNMEKPEVTLDFGQNRQTKQTGMPVLISMRICSLIARRFWTNMSGGAQDKLPP